MTRVHLVHLVIDAANVVGSRPDGWWRDRAGAAARLVDAVAAALAAGTLESPVTVVLEGAARAGVPAGWRPVAGPEGVAGAGRGGVEGVPAGVAGAATAGAEPAPGLAVLHAERDGDSAIAALVQTLVGDKPDVVVVTADRGLRARVLVAGARVVGPSSLHDRL
jgi:hypothetical protein